MGLVETVVVYNFRVYEVEREAFQVSSFKVPRDLIAARYGGDVLEGTAEEVESAALDERGRYRRIATGWGELD